MNGGRSRNVFVALLQDEVLIAYLRTRNDNREFAVQHG